MSASTPSPSPAQASFTPGEWKQSGDDVFAADGIAVHLGEPLHEFRDYGQRKANARLIAASPSLYAACKAVQDAMNARPGMGDAWYAEFRDVVTAAIALAEGK